MKVIIQTKRHSSNHWCNYVCFAFTWRARLNLHLYLAPHDGALHTYRNSCLCFADTWSLRTSLSLKMEPQMAHAKFAFSWIADTCLRRENIVVNPRPHWSQSKVDPPCLTIWAVSWCFSRNSDVHSSQLYFSLFPFLCLVRTCFLRPCGVWNVLPQSWQR